MLFKLTQKLIAGMLVLSICLGFTSCFKKDDSIEGDGESITAPVLDEKLFSEVEEVQNNILLLESGKLNITSQADSTRNTEITKADFVFDVKDDGRLCYIQYQYDKKGKIIACEYSDGVTIEQWLIGNGWCTMSTNPYTQENTHRYLQLLSNTPSEDAIDEIVLEEKTNTNLYTIALNSEELNLTTYKDSAMEVQNEMVEINVDKNGNMSSYLNTARLKNSETDIENVYTLEIALSDYDEEIVRPDLKEYNQGHKDNDD